MNSAKMEYGNATYLEVSNELQLRSPGGDGIENSDGSRVSEFIDYISERRSLPFPIHYTILELIIASMNDAIVENKCSCSLKVKFYNYIKPKLKDNRYYPHIPYWISIKSKEEYPVGILLESYLKNGSKIESS